MEGIHFTETPEQRRDRMRASIDWKLRNGYMLDGDEYGLLKQENDSAAIELAEKIESDVLDQDMEVYRATCRFK